MSPVFGPTVAGGDQWTVRLVGPAAAVWPGTVAVPTPFLNCGSMVARPLPANQLPDSPDLVAGSWTGRLGDSGEATLQFPNRVASDGTPWRQRFDPTGHLQWVEIYRNGELDFTGVIDQIPTIDPTQVQIHASDGWWLLKKAYVRDWSVIASPRDVIERGTGVWVPVYADNYPGGQALNGAWTITYSGAGGANTILPNGGWHLQAVTPSNNGAEVEAVATFPVPSTAEWAVSTMIRLTGSWKSSCGWSLAVSDQTMSTGDTSTGYVTEYDVGATPQLGFFVDSGQAKGTSATRLGREVNVRVECDGEWVWAFVDGSLLSCTRAVNAQVTRLALTWVLDAPASTNCGIVVYDTLVETWQPLLMRGTDRGDYVLPGDATTFPTGGLSAQYFNDNDMSGMPTSVAANTVLSPSRWNAYVGSGGPEYMDQTDPNLDGQDPPGFQQQNPGPGTAALANWSCIWSGAIYLKLSAGNYSFSWSGGGGTPRLRVWIGKTQFGEQVCDEWNGATSGSFTVNAAELVGTLPYGAGTVARDGWYPIRIEISCGVAQSLPVLTFTPPASYTDPGGTTLTGAQSTLVPSTSLSPLGCINQRYQGISHYDLVQQTVQAYGYQAAVEPKQLESGLFPGVLAPRVREGHDTDVVLAPDLGPRQDGENVLNYSSGLDATDMAVSLFGNGAGIQNGNTGQLQAMVFDPSTMNASLFDVQQWQDFSDASSPELLDALLNAQLGLQLEPWQLLSADPNGRPRKAFTWPLPGTVATMNWRPGDGLRIHARDIGVWDTAPRQMLTITRSFVPLGNTSTTAAWADRPKTPAHTLKGQLFKATRWARNYQRQTLTITGSVSGSHTITADGTDTATQGTQLILLPNDTIVRIRLTIAENDAGAPLHVFVNGTDVTASVGGSGYTAAPTIVDLTSFVGVSAQGTMNVVLHNAGSASTNAAYQAVAQILR